MSNERYATVSAPGDCSGNLALCGANVDSANLDLSPDTDMGWTGQQVGATRACG